ncbi:MAG TPA: TonB-dependent receptor, partial [Novosphingobium sp.]|nr:TonB-dependent receptor [Novosphingobium sp.]
DLSSIAVRLRYRAELGDKVTFNLIGDYNQTRDNGFSLQTFRAATPGSPLAGALAACGLNVGPDNTSNCQGLPAFYHTAVGGVSGQFDVKLGSATLTSITSWRQREERTAVDVVEIAPAIARQYLSGCVLPANAQYACSPLTSLVAGSGDDPHSVRNTLITQELRLASAANHHLEWVAGLYFQRAVYAEALPLTVSINPALPAGVPDIVTVNSTAINAAHASDYAVFGNVTYFLRPDTRLIGGLRFTHSDVWETTSNAVNLGSSAFFTGTGKADVVTWRAGVQHDFTPATMAYFTAATGYKAPEIDDSKTTMPAIKPEEPLSLEMGIKQTVLHGKFYINADLFYTDVRNFQTQSCVYGLGGLTCSSVNVPHVHTHGLEWDIFGHPFTGTTVNISGIYNIAKYSHGFLGADRSDLGGFQLNYAPRFKMTVSLEQA